MSTDTVKQQTTTDEDAERPCDADCSIASCLQSDIETTKNLDSITRVTLTNNDLIMINWALEEIEFEDEENKIEFKAAHEKLLKAQDRLEHKKQ